EDVITELARWRSLAVTSRNSTFRFKGKSVDMQRLGLELGVRFLVEGSVRRMGERIRITAQLIDAESGNHVWGERFDRPVADLFAAQDQVVQTIVGTLVGPRTGERSRSRPPQTPVQPGRLRSCAARQRAPMGRPRSGGRGEARLPAGD